MEISEEQKPAEGRERIRITAERDSASIKPLNIGIKSTKAGST